MTIKTLEERVGMTRASIRFYEDQGFLAPARRENGYRDYSDADAEVLRKIKLFRSLYLDLDAIHRLQSGELTLDQALADQLSALEADQAALDRARQVCRELRESGTSYAALDPAPWLEKLEKPPVPASPRYAPPADVPADAPEAPDAVRWPWRRFFAREVDLLLCGLLWSAVSLVVFHWWLPREQPGEAIRQIFNSYMAWGLLFLFEPLLLHLFGATPGKALFAISVRDGDGNKLSWKQALRRTWGVFSRGYGYNLPVYAQWRMWKNYKACQDGQRNEDWEGCLQPDQTFEWETYRVADGRMWRCLVCAGVYVLYFGLGALIALQASLPPNRGALTAEEFYENCNFYIDYLGAGDRQLNREGQLAGEPVFMGGAIVYMGGSIDTAFSAVLNDGIVTGVTVTRQAETDAVLWDSSIYKEVAVLALAGSRPEANALNFYGIAREADRFFQEDANHFFQETGGSYTRSLSFASPVLPALEVRQVTRLENFHALTGTLVPEDGKTGRFWQEFTVTVSP